VMIHFCGRVLNLIALLKLRAAAALHAINADNGTYIVINSEDYIILPSYSQSPIVRVHYDLNY
jgi:hypothetical protein